jgi:hypothetical protein
MTALINTLNPTTWNSTTNKGTATERQKERKNRDTQKKSQNTKKKET